MAGEVSAKTYAKLESEAKKPVVITKDNITGAQLDTLIALVENGPIDDGHVPSKAGRSDLVDQGFAARIINKGEQGFNAATYKGCELYCQCYGEETVKEAKAKRIMLRELRSVSQQ